MSFSEALAEAGLFRLWLPSAMGGPELSPAEFMQVVEGHRPWMFNRLDRGEWRRHEPRCWLSARLPLYPRGQAL
jgi:hypothetical protein